MGKRSAAKKPTGPKKREGLPTAFTCLFCNHDNSVTVKINKKAGIGELSCKICGQSYQTGTNYLSQNVDVYSDWVDACEAVAKEAASGQGRSARSNGPLPAAARRARNDDEDEDGADEHRTAEDDAFIENDELDGEADFAD